MYRSVIYLPNICASCDGSLDKAEQDLKFFHPAFYCNRSQELGHLTLACQAPHCLTKFSDIKDLKNHSIRNKHVTLNCGIAGCNAALTASSVNIAEHYLEQHPEISGLPCVKCELSFKVMEELASHCRITGHAGFVCRFPGCGAECIHYTDLKRHQLIHKRKTTTYPCAHCRTYRGTRGFKRKDHLVQHMRNYHRMEDYTPINGVCRERGCHFRYITLGSLTEHMLEVHHSLTYVCREANCDRVGMNGFENDKDLKSHVKSDHISAYQCTQSGCDRIGSNGWKRKRDMVKHIEKVHGVSVDPQNIR
ncbi:hypothetical protein F5882DRAFT_313340 [Hyaloscypha sp. PMI_1271]|nr:hypothetical protein F5882DRAFT_313340 [Hyaloscypha sp. PMI_1271]